MLIVALVLAFLIATVSTGVLAVALWLSRRRAERDALPAEGPTYLAWFLVVLVIAWGGGLVLTALGQAGRPYTWLPLLALGIGAAIAAAAMARRPQ
ncbi:MAG TPA: hypothetical protein VEL07_19775 [Planctomycetota bacterium]|nr:hypothetical protein [Planctomycetota bacterium]